MNIKNAKCQAEIKTIISYHAAQVNYSFNSGISYAQAATGMQAALDSLSGFSEECYLNHSIHELTRKLSVASKQIDCEAFGLTSDEWTNEIEKAILALQGEKLLPILIDANKKWHDLEA